MMNLKSFCTNATAAPYTIPITAIHAIHHFQYISPCGNSIIARAQTAVRAEFHHDARQQHATPPSARPRGRSAPTCETATCPASTREADEDQREHPALHDRGAIGCLRQFKHIKGLAARREVQRPTCR